jgi:hypothetical protein
LEKFADVHRFVLWVACYVGILRVSPIPALRAPDGFEAA